jgi:hypothetical protein
MSTSGFRGGTLKLKGGEVLKKKTKKPCKAASVPEDEREAGHAAGAGGGAKAMHEPVGITTKGKSYEEEFEFEKKRIEAGSNKSTPWGSSYRAAPAILHGYTAKVTGKTAEERLDMRAATKTDRFCK